MLPEGMDMSALLEQAQAMQDKFQQAQEELAASTFTGTAGGELVTVKISGIGELQTVDIKPEAVDMDDLESLGDLIVAAVRDATVKMSEKAAQVMPQIPGMGL